MIEYKIKKNKKYDYYLINVFYKGEFSYKFDINGKMNWYGTDFKLEQIKANKWVNGYKYKELYAIYSEIGFKDHKFIYRPMSGKHHE